MSMQCCTPARAPLVVACLVLSIVEGTLTCLLSVTQGSGRVGSGGGQGHDPKTLDPTAQPNPCVLWWWWWLLNQLAHVLVAMPTFPTGGIGIAPPIRSLDGSALFCSRRTEQRRPRRYAGQTKVPRRPSGVASR